MRHAGAETFETDHTPSRRRQHAPHFPCPCCGAHGKLRSSTFISHTLRRLYYYCDDVMECGHTWSASLEFEKSIHPSRIGPVRQTVPFLRLKPPL